MDTKTSAHYQRLYRQRLREQGLVKKEVWILPEHARMLLNVEKQLRQPAGMTQSLSQESNMTAAVSMWTSNKLFDALSAVELFKNGGASVELVQGTDPSLHIIMHEFGDLPVFISVVGEQIIVESILWPTDAVKDVNAFNEEVLRTHKFFPLSTIGIEKLAENDFYIMFGALSSESSLSNVMFEIEILSDNVIKATEAFEDYLKV
ncbi:biofilm formation regulator BacA [Entomomonas asaccharolytica]|uniref:YjfI family protein n=1 Tax=Entomomonas asaccharolytica TaxID=2785331 RepID=A0A974RY07_9GAMM|nr:YjfI family protein [Entomomonas asaccharolytica]QQP86677.1 YjfI family protein [Entomomonas asaccharolytica]